MRANSRERLLSTLNLEEPDMVPVTPFVWAEFTCGFMNVPFWKAEEHPYSWNYQIEVFKRFKVDGKCIIDMPGVLFSKSKVVERGRDYFITESVVRTPEGKLSARWRRSRTAATWLLNPLIKDESELGRLEHFLSETVENWRPYIKILEAARNKLGNRGIIGPIYLSPLAWAGYTARGMINLLKDLYRNPRLVEKLVRLGYEYHTKICTEVGMESGADFINPAWLAGIGPKHFDRYEVPYLKREVERARKAGLKSILHIDGACHHVLESAAGIGSGGIETLEPPTLANGNVEIDDAKTRIGDRMCLMGNVDAVNTLLRGTPTDVENAVLDRIQKAAYGGGYVLMSSENLCTHTPVENLMAFVRTGRKYGKYPSTPS